MSLLQGPGKGSLSLAIRMAAPVGSRRRYPLGKVRRYRYPGRPLAAGDTGFQLPKLQFHPFEKVSLTRSIDLSYLNALMPALNTYFI